MKFILPGAILFGLVLIASCSTVRNNQDNALESPYLGQKPPGSMPEPFAPGLVTTEGYEFGGAFAPELKEFYFIRNSPESNKHELVIFSLKDGEWQKSEIFPRRGTHVFSPDGSIMHLGRRFMERKDNGWSELKSLPAPFENLPIMRLSSSKNGTYYFDEFKRDLTGSIRFSRRVNGKHEQPKPIGKEINTGKSFHPFIAPDESYIIFDSTRENGYGDSDLYISYRQNDGAWGKAINLGEKINTQAWEAAATITSDGKYMFFNRNMGSKNYENVDIFWVSAGFIKELKKN